MHVLQATDLAPPQLVRLPESLSQVFAYWRSKLRNRRMPARADIDPSEIRALLPYMILVDVVYGADSRPDFFYRLVGTREVEIRGGDPTGQRVAEAFHGPSAENAIGCYARVVEARAPLLDDEYFVRDGDRYADEPNLFLPLSNDGEGVNMVLVFTAYRRL